MDYTRLADFDELVVRCRDAQARSHIAEAVASYRAGAFRACIVTTWIAVVYDIMAKLRELASAGDAAATAEVNKLANIVANHDVEASLEFERSILDLAKNSFSLLTPNEYADLARLRDDRNRCAHPSMNSLEQPYVPTAELARLHLRSAVQHLLMQEPVQGKAALDRLYADVESAYFPTNPEKAREFLSQGPLRRPKDNLVTNFTASLVTSLLREQPMPFDKFRRRASALNATRAMHRALVEPVLASKATSVISTLPDDQLPRAAQFIALVTDTWALLPSGVTDKLSAFVDKLDPTVDPLTLSILLDVPELATAVRSRIAATSAKGLAALIAHRPRPEFVPSAINHYVASGSFVIANSHAHSLIIPLASLFNKDQLEELMQRAAANSEVTGSFELASALGVLRGANIVPPVDFDALKAKYNL